MVVNTHQCNTIALLEPDLPSMEQLAPYFSRVLASGQYSNFGPMVVAMESRVAEVFYPGGPEPVCCVSTSSGTTAIEISLQALRLSVGSRVLMPAFSFPAAAQAVARLGYVPIFASVDNATWQLTPASAERILASTDFAAVIPITSLGYAEDADSWGRFSALHGLPVIIDAAAALGNQLVAPGTIVVSSLHATKALGIGEGGLIATTDHSVAERLRALTNFGFVNRLATEIGGNAKLSEWHAAVAHAQLDRWEHIRSSRAWVRDRYRQHLDGIPLGLHPQAWTVPVPAFMPVKMPSGCIGEQLVATLEAAGIGARRWNWPALPDHPAFSEFPTWNSTECPLADTRDLAASLVCLPFHTRLTDSDIRRVADVVRKVIAQT